MVDKLKEVYESDPLAMASSYGVEAVDPEETVEAVKDVARFGWESLPGVGTYYTVQDITEELEQENPNYMRIGMLAGTEVIGLIPGIGDAAANLIRKGAKFKTKRGSVYTVEDESRTTRERAPDTPDGDFVKQPTSGKTIYMSYEDMNRFGPLFQKGEPGLYQFRPSGEGKAQLVFTKDYGPHKAGDPVPDTEVSFTLEPELGMNPVEIYDSTNNARTSIHFGNEIIEVESDIPKVPRGKTGPSVVDIEADVVEAERLLDDPDALKAWQEENKLPETQRQANPEESKLAADALFEGEATSQETRRRIREAIPAPQEFTAEQVMEMMPTVTEVTGSLGKKAGKYGILGVKGFDLKEGQKVSSRLDIPAYNNYNTWVVSIHDGTKDAGLVEGFGQAVRLKNIEFKSNVGLPAIDIARGKRFVKTTGEDAPKPQGKATIARIFGEYTSEDPYDLQRQAADIIASGSEEWTQVGMNPYRGSAFYDKKTGMPVFEADEVIQVGPLVLAKNVKKPTISQMKEMAVRTRDGKLRMFNEGGMAMDEQMDAVFKSSRTGYAVGGSVDLDSVPDNTVGMDPVSGNEIPLGSLPEEVRDDIPAQLSEGEYVVPADVVRYYGVKFFEDLRAEAKFGYQDMEENGRIGGEPTGMEMVEPEDDMMFDISELEVMEVPDEEPVGAFFGGFFSSKEKEKSPEEKVRERFKEVSKREKQKRTVVKNADGTTKTVYSTVSGGAGVDDDNNSQPSFDGPSIAEQINFGGDYSDKPKKEKKKSNKSVRKAYTASPKDVRDQMEQQQGTNLLADKPDAMGNLMNALGFNEGGWALMPGDPGFEEEGALGLGSEGIGLGTGDGVSAVEMVAYVHEDGRVIYILHINGIPQNEIPAGFYPRTDEENTEEEDSTDEAVEESQAVVQSDDDGGPDIEPPTPIDYDKLTLDEIQEMIDDQKSPKMNVVAAGLGALNPLMGLFMKGAMMHQAKQLKNEMNRRLAGELTTQDRTRLEGMLKEAEESGGLLKKIIEGIKGEEEKEPEATEAYTPEVAAGSVTLPTTPKPEGMLETSTDDLVKAFAPPEAFAMEEYKVAQQKKAQQKVDNPPTVEYSQSGTDDVIQAMQDRDAPQAAISAAQKEAEKVKSAVSDINRGVQRGFKKGGLASKRGKKKK